MRERGRGAGHRDDKGVFRSISIARPPGPNVELPLQMGIEGALIDSTDSFPY